MKQNRNGYKLSKFPQKILADLFVYCDAIFALPEALFFGWYKISIAPEAYMKPRRLCLFLL